VNPQVRADAEAAAALAAGAAVAAARLVEINLATMPNDIRVRRVQAAAEEARRSTCSARDVIR
jgi:formiminotetrahydrofolate cyclodeaminase